MIGNKLKDQRKKHHETQADIAELLQTTKQQISKYELDIQELPIRHLITLCHHWRVSADFILEIEKASET